jgi:hypothetical protein
VQKEIVIKLTIYIFVTVLDECRPPVENTDAQNTPKATKFKRRKTITATGI